MSRKHFAKHGDVWGHVTNSRSNENGMFHLLREFHLMRFTAFTGDTCKLQLHFVEIFRNVACAENCNGKAATDTFHVSGNSAHGTAKICFWERLNSVAKGTLMHQKAINTGLNKLFSLDMSNVWQSWRTAPLEYKIWRHMETRYEELMRQGNWKVRPE